MSQNTHLTKKQFKVIEDLLTSGLKESEILQKYKISSSLYNKWINDENFIRQLENRIAIVLKRNAARIADNVSIALDKLFKMAQGSNDISRKACLDIIALQKQVTATNPPARNESKQPEKPASVKLSDEAAGKLLAALAEEK